MKYKLPKSSGFLPNPPDFRDLWEDEILAGDAPSEPLPIRYRTENLPFESQGALPFCCSFATTTMFEEYYRRKSGGIVIKLSQPHLFFHSGGGPTGSYFRGNLEIARSKGCISYADCSMPLDPWNPPAFDLLKKSVLEVPFKDPKTITGYVRIEPTREALQRAVIRYGAVLVGVVASGGWWKPGVKRVQDKADNHAVLLCGFEANGDWWVFDSLQPTKDFDGYHLIDKDYGFSSCYAITDLPEDWKQKRDEARVQPQGNKDRYGKPGNFMAEIQAENAIYDGFQRFLDAKIIASAGRDIKTYVNAVAYGGYTVTVPNPWFPWRGMPGDIVRDAETYFLTKKRVFDFDLPKSAYK